MEEKKEIEQPEQLKSNRWKMTEKKYKKLKGMVLFGCAAFIVYLCLLVRWAMKVNPGAFVYNPVTDAKPPMAILATKIWYVVIAAWIIVIILFIREIYKHKNHWFWKLRKKMEELDEEKEE